MLLQHPLLDAPAEQPQADIEQPVQWSCDPAALDLHKLWADGQPVISPQPEEIQQPQEIQQPEEIQPWDPEAHPYGTMEELRASLRAAEQHAAAPPHEDLEQRIIAVEKQLQVGGEDIAFTRCHFGQVWRRHEALQHEWTASAPNRDLVIEQSSLLTHRVYSLEQWSQTIPGVWDQNIRALQTALEHVEVHVQEVAAGAAPLRRQLMLASTAVFGMLLFVAWTQ